MELISGLISNVFGFLGATAFSALSFLGAAVSMSDTYIVTSPLHEEEIVETIEEAPANIDYSNLVATTSVEVIEETEELFTMTAPAPITQIVFNNDASYEARFAGLLAHVRWLIDQDDRVVYQKSNNSGDLFDKQIEKTTDDVLESMGDVRNDLESDITSLSDRLTSAEADLASISLAAASTSVMAANLTLNGHWLSGDGADEGVFVSAAGNVGVGTSTPTSRFAVAGDIYATGALRDSSNGAGTAGMVLQTTGSGTEWVATSSLGITGGGSSFTTSAELAALLSDEVGTGGGFVRASSSALTSPNIFGATLIGSIAGGTFTSGTWQGNAISSTYLDSAVILGTEIDSSSELITLVSDETGTGALVFANSPTLSGTLSGANATFSGTLGVSGVATLATTTASTLTVTGALRDSSASAGTSGYVLQSTGSGTAWVATSTLGITGGGSSFTTSAELAALLSDETGSGAAVFANSPILVTPNLGTPSAITLTNATGLPIATGVDGLAAGVAAFLASSTSANLAAAVSNETGSGSLVFATSPTFSTQLFVPQVVGGSTGASSLALKSTSGVGTTDFIRFLVGNNGATEAVRIITNGNVGIGTTTPDSKLTVAGDIFATGALRDSSNGAGTAGMVLQTTGSGTQWVATSSLGFPGGSGVTNFLALTDTPSSYTANRVMYTNSGATALIDSADFTYDGTNLGLGGAGGIAFGGTRYITASTTNDSVAFGENAGATFSSSTLYQVAIGFEAGRYASTSVSNSIMIGYQAGLNNTAGNNNLIGYSAGSNNTGINNNFLGSYAGQNNAGGQNNFIGTFAGRDFTDVSGSNNNFMGNSAGRLSSGSYNNLFGENAGRNNAGSYNNMFGYRVGYYSAGSYNVLIGSESMYGSGSASTTRSNNVAIGYRTGYNATTGADNNVLIGHGTAENLTTGASNIVIGYDVDIASSTGNNQLNIGNLIFGTDVDGTGLTLSSGNIGIGTSLPGSKLTVAGDFYATGALRDSSNLVGTAGMVLQTTGSGTQWVATSTLGLGGGGASTFLALTDTPSSYTANRIMYTNSGATALTDTANFVFDGTNLGVGTSTPNNLIQVYDLIDFDNTETRTRLGYQAGKNLVTGAQNNTFVGYRAGYASTTGSTNFADSNTGIGAQVLYNNASGNGNTVAGNLSMYNNVSGSSNVTSGNLTLYSNTTGDNNVALGYTAMYSNISGGSNTSVGMGAAYSSASASHNTALGYNALYSNTGGVNTAVGSEAMYSNTGSFFNTAIGYQALRANTDGGTNSAIGYQAGRYLTDGTSAASSTDNSVYLGANTKALTTNDQNSIVIGYNANGLGSNTVVLGNDSITTTALKGNVGIGTTTPGSKLTVAGDIFATGAFRDSSNASGTLGMVLQSTGTSTRWVATSTLGISGGGGGSLFTDGGAVTYLTATGDNLAIGTTTAPDKLTVEGNLRLFGGINFGTNERIIYRDAGNNVMFGLYALTHNENSNVYANTAIGDGAGGPLQYGFSNVFMGFEAGANVATGSRSVIIGNQAVGSGAVTADIGSMVVIGDGAGYNLADGANWSTLVGYRAGENITDGSGNTIFGYQAGNNITTGWENIVIGYDIDAPSASSFRTLNIGNLIFGTGLDGSGTTLATGNIGIGTTTPGSKLTVAGTIQATNLLGGATNLTTDANGNIIRDASDARLKENVETLDNALEKVLALRGVTYEWIDKERFGEQVEIGFIAQEVDEVVPEVVTKGGEYWSLNSKNLIAVVVEAMKEVWAKVSGHEERLGELEAENAELKARLDAVEQELNIDNNPAPDPVPAPIPAPEETIIDDEVVVDEGQDIEEVVPPVEETNTEIVPAEPEPEVTEPAPAPEGVAPEVVETEEVTP